MRVHEHSVSKHTGASKPSRPGNQQSRAELLDFVHERTAGVSQRKLAEQKENQTGLPNHLKAGIERLSSRSMDDVKVNYNSYKPAQLQAHAYTQGSHIYLAPGQEQHLPHEAWHVVQQKQGRVTATMQLNGGVGVNDDPVLEREANMMGARANRFTVSMSSPGAPAPEPTQPQQSVATAPVQGCFLEIIKQKIAEAQKRKRAKRRGRREKKKDAVVATRGDSDSDSDSDSLRPYEHMMPVASGHEKSGTEARGPEQPHLRPVMKVEPGPKAGFEIEFNSVLVFDVTRVDQQIQSLQEGLKDARYEKRHVLFSSPAGTWEGQADTTLSTCSNLEIVTKPLSPAQWSSEAAQSDEKHFLEFLEGLRKAPAVESLTPHEIYPHLAIRDSNARLRKLAKQPTSQTQMTRAEEVEWNSKVVPGWWIEGLDWRAVPYMKKHIVIPLKKELQSSNPKSAFAGKILKTPIIDLLYPTKDAGVQVEPEDRATWREGMLDRLGLKGDGDKIVAAGLVDASRGQFRLKPTGFTWTQYLENLLDGKDLITKWAETAFVVGDEDIGLGQISDESIRGTHVVIEHRRQYEKVVEYIDEARAWARPLLPDLDSRTPTVAWPSSALPDSLALEIAEGVRQARAQQRSIEDIISQLEDFLPQRLTGLDQLARERAFRSAADVLKDPRVFPTAVDGRLYEAIERLLVKPGAVATTFSDRRSSFRA